MCQCIGRCTLIGAARFSDIKEPKLFFILYVIWHDLMVYRSPAWVLPLGIEPHVAPRLAASALEL
jgi:hypothetical protein